MFDEAIIHVAPISEKSTPPTTASLFQTPSLTSIFRSWHLLHNRKQLIYPLRFAVIGLKVAGCLLELIGLTLLFAHSHIS
jgi:hypothetical protein